MEKLLKLVIFSCILSFTAAAEWYKTASFYQIYPQTFYDDGASGRDIKGFGSLTGIEKKLEYLKSLGIDCIWLTPVFESKAFNAFGYDITNYQNIDKRYGTLDHFKHLVEEIHKNDMKIIVDFVPNHCGVDHPDFQASVKGEDNKGDWFVWATTDAEESKPSNWQRIGGGVGTAWNYHKDKVAEKSEPATTPVQQDDEGVDETPEFSFYYAQFNGNMPDWNLQKDEVKNYMKDVLKFWMDAGVDGFRIDAISHAYEALPDDGKTYNDYNETVNDNIVDLESFDLLNHTYTQDQPDTFKLVYEWRQFIDDYTKEKNMTPKVIMTESYSSPDVIKKFYRSEDGKLGAHLPFNFQMITKIKNDSKAADIVKTISDWMENIAKDDVTNWVIGNHDNSRVATRFGEDRVDIMNVLVSMLKGASVTYYGEEIGMSDSCAKYNDDHNKPATKCDDPKEKVSDAWFRSPMQWKNATNAGFSTDDPWIPVASNYQTVNVESQEGKEKSHLEIYRSLMKLRKHEALMSDGKFEIKALGTNSFGFIREINDVKKQSVFVVINFGTAKEKVKIRETFNTTSNLMTVEIASGKSKHSKGHQINSDSEFELDGNEALVLFYNSSTTLLVSKLILGLSIFIHRLFSV